MFMKTQTKKLLFILILVVSIMAILITASQIYDILDNEKVIDNEIDGIDSTEDKPIKKYDKVSNEIQISLYEFNKDGNLTSTNYKDYLTYIGNETNNALYSIIMHERSDTSWFSANLRFTVDKNVKLNTTLYLMLESGSQSFGRNFQNYGADKVTIGNYETQTTQQASFIYTGQEEIRFSINNQYQAPNPVVNGTFMSSFTYGFFKNSVRFYLAAEYYEPEENTVTYGENPKISIENNELLQTTTTIDGKKLSQYNYEQITDEWGEGKELATIKCSIGEYYDENGNLAISTQNNDLPMLFNIGDLVIPYIAVANGQTEPLSLKLDGTPKVFKVTQIRPYFDGAFWQELTLQEHTK